MNTFEKHTFHFPIKVLPLLWHRWQLHVLAVAIKDSSKLAKSKFQMPTRSLPNSYINSNYL